MAGRVEFYVHSDKSVPNKGGAMVMVTSKTDFAARTDEFIEFTKLAAKFAFAADATTWDDIAVAFPNIEADRLKLSKEIKEPVTIDQIVVMKV
jgi:translation elongation factor EF-Ts